MNEKTLKPSICHELEIETLDKLAALPNRPGGMEPFDRLFREEVRVKELQNRSAPVVGQFCDFIPEELIIALGAIPLRLDFGCHHAIEKAELYVPNDVCCAIRVAAGDAMQRVGLFSLIDLLVVPTSCDGKKKLASVLSSKYEVFTLQLPQSQQEENTLSWWFQEIHRFIRRLQRLTGRSLRKSSLRRSILLLNQRSALLRRMNETRKQRILPLRGIDAFLVMHASFIADPHWWQEKTELLIQELEKRVVSQQGVVPRARLLLTGSPILWPDYKLLLMIVGAGADVVIDEMCSGTQRLYYPTVVDEWTKGGLIRAVAERTLLPCTCPCFVDGQGRKDRLLDQIQSFEVDGVVHHTLRLCGLYDMDLVNLVDMFKELRMPWINLYTEMRPEEARGIKNRIDAFVEVIQEDKSHL